MALHLTITPTLRCTHFLFWLLLVFFHGCSLTCGFLGVRVMDHGQSVRLLDQRTGCSHPHYHPATLVTSMRMQNDANNNHNANNSNDNTAAADDAEAATSTASMTSSNTKTTDTKTATTNTANTQLADWVIENLESDGQSITSASTVKAGEGDTLPQQGLIIGKVRILAADAANDSNNDDGDDDKYDNDEHYYKPIRLLVGRNGWGTGVHPTTRLCLEWICDIIQGGEIVLDYGCGSGILSIAALHMGAARCIGVDVEAEALVTAERNVMLNDYDTSSRFEGLHTRQVVPYGFPPHERADVCVANILMGQLVRPSMVAAMVTNLKPGAYLCMSGIRPHEVEALQQAYNDNTGNAMEWMDDQYAELSATETEGSLASYGFDCGRWARVVGRKRASIDEKLDIERMSELAVS